jgi:hypothetical protein
MYISSHRCKKQVGIGKTPAMDGASSKKKKKKIEHPLWVLHTLIMLSTKKTPPRTKEKEPG